MLGSLECPNCIDICVVDVYGVDELLIRKTEMIGKLEELALLAVLQAGEGSVPSAIYDALIRATEGQEVAGFGAVYTTLDRLAKKGLLKEAKIVDQQGRSRRAFSISGAGQTALRQNLRPARLLGGFALGGV